MSSRSLTRRLVKFGQYFRRLLFVLAVGVFIGGGSALLLTSGARNARLDILSNTRMVSGWQVNMASGSAAANVWERAHIAITGLLALPRSEVLYYMRDTDDDGNRLQENCNYSVTGGDLPAQWWSITLYAADNYLPRNTDQALSMDKTRVVKGDSQHWQIYVQPQRPVSAALAPNWISSRAGGKFDLTLRLYVPEKALLANPQTLSAPRVQKISCIGMLS